MGKDINYVNGAVAVRECRLLGEKLGKMCEGSAEEAFRILVESGFGRGEEAQSAFDYEKLVASEERELDRFIFECAPSDADVCYLLSSRDFYNAKTLLKAVYLGISAEEMLSSKGEYSIQLLADCIKNANYTPLCDELAGAIKEGADLFLREEATGTKIGVIFEKALYAHLMKRCKSRALKELLIARADMLNIQTAFRARSDKEAKEAFVSGGKLTKAELIKTRSLDGDSIMRSFSDSPYKKFVGLCIEARQNKTAFSEAEKYFDSFDVNYFAEKRGELKGSQTFLYYALKRKAECRNVRMIMVCLFAGMNAQSIRARLRAM